MRKIYTLPRARGRFTASRVLLAVGALAVILGLAVRHGVEWPRSAVANAPVPLTAQAATPARESTVYFPSQYELHAGPPETQPDTF